MTPEEQRTLELFEIVESHPDFNQRQLARELGISLGLVNAFMKTVLSKGWLRARKVTPRRWLYFLTPKGYLEKSRLSLNYLKRTLKSFRDLRVKADNVIASLSKQGVKGVHLVGDQDLTEIARISLGTHKIICLSTIIKPRGKNIRLNSWMPDIFPGLKSSQRFLITLLEEQDLLVTELVQLGYKEKKHWVRMI